jgi:hypothetical protein
MTKGRGPAKWGITPFVWFGVAIIAGAAYAVFAGLEYYNVPTFTSAALPTIAGVAAAVVAFLIIGAQAPPKSPFSATAMSVGAAAARYRSSRVRFTLRNSSPPRNPAINCSASSPRPRMASAALRASTVFSCAIRP